MEVSKFKSLTVDRGQNGMILRGGNGKEATLYYNDAGKLKIGGWVVGNMPKTIAEIKALATFTADVAAYLDGILQ